MPNSGSRFKRVFKEKSKKLPLKVQKLLTGAFSLLRTERNCNMQKKLLKSLLPGDYAGPKIGSKKYIVSADIQQLGSTSILRATVFTGESGHPYFTVFCSHEAFVSWNHREKKWSDAMLDNTP